MRPKPSPERAPDFYTILMLRLNEMFKSRGATQRETVIIAAQFVGLVVAEAPPAEREAQLEVAVRALRTAFAGKTLQLSQHDILRGR